MPTSIMRTRNNRTAFFAAWPADDLALQRICNFISPPLAPSALRTLLESGSSVRSTVGSLFFLKPEADHD